MALSQLPGCLASGVQSSLGLRELRTELRNIRANRVDSVNSVQTQHQEACQPAQHLHRQNPNTHLLEAKVAESTSTSENLDGDTHTPSAIDCGQKLQQLRSAAPFWALLLLLRGLLGGDASLEELAMLLVARCRAEGRPARLAMALPLPAAGSCGSLLAADDLELPLPSVWAEIFDEPAGRWRALAAPAAVAAAASASTLAFLWVLSCGPSSGDSPGAMRDVTRRYCGRWSAVLEARGSLGRSWDVMLLRLGRGTSEDGPMACADRLDEARLARKARQEPLPSSRAGFKRHSGYVLDSQLRQHELVHPAHAKPVGLFQGKEPIWRRGDVAELRSAVQWRREGREVTEGERPMKTSRGGSSFAMQLFGSWQTKALALPPPQVCLPSAAGGQFGPIPGTNSFGSLEMTGAGSRAQSLPPGTVYLEQEIARSAAARLGVHFAPAVVGFLRENGQVKPRFGGCVVWLKDQADVLAFAEEERERLEELEAKKKAERMEAAWRLLIKSVLVDLYVETRYAGRDIPV
ncbi:unnamed protein product [Polarella glacialis]|uniref:Uncharacterized protein n=1 Tax=Polarella glacialis TaxID=89957 RepID=A0A813GXW9_POLGL|nr:unnamed protein product [Polarella glacialis]